MTRAGTLPKTVLGVDMTTWKVITGHEDYMVSDEGEVYSDKKGRDLKPWPKGGYPCVRLDGQDYRVHKLVALMFIGPCPEGLQVRHLDDNPLNNNLSNLTYGTPKENIADSIRNGTNFQLNKTHCPRGHELGIATPGRSRKCNACENNWQKERYRRRYIS